MLLLVAGLAAAMILLTSFLGPKNRNPIKDLPFETGMAPFQILSSHIPVKFYLVALLFVVFDVELTFLFPWALIFRQLGLMGLASMTLFLGLLFVTLIYAWKKEVLKWR